MIHLTKNQIFGLVIQLEGGRHLHEIKGDSGGRTYAGLSERWNGDWEGWAMLNQGRNPPDEMLFARYEEFYWNPLHLDLLIGVAPILAAIAFDFGFMAGVGDARSMMRRLTNDNDNWPVALGGLNNAMLAKKVIQAERIRIEHHLNRIKKAPGQVKFLAGWVTRARYWTDLSSAFQNL